MLNETGEKDSIFKDILEKRGEILYVLLLHIMLKH